MNWRWLIGDIVDPNIPLSFRERWAITKAAMANAAGDPAGCGWMLLGAGIVAGLGVFIYSMCGGIVALVAIMFFPHMILAIAAGAPALFGRQHLMPYVSRELQSRGFAVCLRCGYWLKGLQETTEHCPECGAPCEAMRVVHPSDTES